MSHFFSEPDSHVISITRKAHLQAGGRGVEVAKSVPLSSPRSASGILAEMVEVPTAGSDALADVYSRDICGLVYVIDGRLQLDAGGLHEVLETGDCVFIETRMPVVWSAGGKMPCRVLVVRPAKSS